MAQTAAPIDGLREIGLLNLRCLVVLAVTNGVVLLGGTVVASLVSDDVDATGGFGQLAYILLIALLVACVPVGLVGVPAGAITARRLRRVPGESVHVLVFALVGAVLAVAIMLLLGAGTASLWASIEGAVGAGGARWWAGAAFRRRARREEAPGPSDEEIEDAQVDAQLDG